MYSDSLNPFGLLNGQLVTINDVSAGLACGCLCPACKQPLVARKGSQNVHHFAHAIKTDCKGALETALHIKAKDILLKNKHIMLPSLPGNLSSKVTIYRYGKEAPLMLQGRCYTVREPIVNKFSYESVFIEINIGQIRPDIVLFNEKGPFLVEIYVSHRTGPEKVSYIKKLDIPCIEVDLRYLKRLNILDDKLVENAVIHAHHTKSWLHRTGEWNVQPFSIKNKVYTYQVGNQAFESSSPWQDEM